jgi:sec-independent protein translocase protein TatB
MFGIGGQEIIIIGLLVLVIFGPSALPRMARDLGRFVTEARRSIDEFKEELTAGADEEDEEDKTEEKAGRKHRGKRHDEEDEHDL